MIGVESVLCTENISGIGQPWCKKGRKYEIEREDEFCYYIHTPIIDELPMAKHQMHKFFDVPPTILVLKCVNAKGMMDLEVGAEYRITEVKRNHIKIAIPRTEFDQDTYSMLYTREPDSIGNSYKTWFTVHEYTLA